MGLHQEWGHVPGDHARLVDAPARLTSKQKAAVIVRLLLAHDVRPGIDRLSHAQQADLGRAMATLGPISRATLAQVVQDFTSRLDGLALTAPRDLAAALALLEPHISPIARDDLRAEAEAGDATDPWSKLAALDVARLSPLLMTESAEVAAILLSKLGVAKAAQCLSDLPGDRAQVIAHAVALTATVTPELVERIGTNLLRQMQDAPKPAFRGSPVDRVGAILNSVGTSLREAVLGGLEARDARFATEVRRAIFTFQHIPKRLEPTDVPRIMRRMEPDVLTRAIAAGLTAAPAVVDFVLANMSKRGADQLRDEAERIGTLRPEDQEAAMAQVVATIRMLEEEGEIRLIPSDE